MKFSDDSSLAPLYYFLAGALIPTMTYTLFLRNNNNITKINKIDFEDDDEVVVDDDEIEDDAFSEGDASSSVFENPLDRLNKNDPSKWGITDAPYKVSENFLLFHDGFILFMLKFARVICSHS